MNAEHLPDASNVAVVSNEERLRELLVSAGSQRRVLLDILVRCATPTPVAEVNEAVARDQLYNYSPLNGANLCGQLREVGALELIKEDGTPFGESRIKPQSVERDGVTYWRISRPGEVFWKTTRVGADAVEAYDPARLIRELLEGDAKYLPVYRSMLHACLADDGMTAQDLSDLVDWMPLVQDPRLYAAHFVVRLEECGAIEWRGRWATTPEGAKALEGIEGITEITGITGIEEKTEVER